MSSPVAKQLGDDLLYLPCPGCVQGHVIAFGAGDGPRWSWNGSLTKPTVSPSILANGVVPITDEEHATLMAGGKVEPRPFVCHSFVTDGRIQFLDDCTHALAGQTVDLPELERQS